MALVSNDDDEGRLTEFLEAMGPPSY